MTDDPFAFQVERLTRRHLARHDAATVAQVTLQQWLSMRHRYNDPFDPELFDHIDTRLGSMPPSSDTDAQAYPARSAVDHRRSRAVSTRGVGPSTSLSA